MSEHKITLTWKRGDTPFEYQKYSRDHHLEILMADTNAGIG